MNISSFIARRITFNQSQSFTKLIINIGITAVALSVMVMILSTSLFKGFKSEITEKVYNFWGHIHISDANTKRTFEAIPIEMDTAFVNRLKRLPPQEYQAPSAWYNFGAQDKFSMKLTNGAIKNISAFIVLPAILDTNKEFEGTYLRGLTKNYEWSRLDPFLKEGRWINFGDSSSITEIVLSRNTSDRINKVSGDQIIVNFVLQGQQIRKRLNIVGIYNTGIEEYDKQFAIVDMKLLQDALFWESNQIAGYEVVLDNMDDVSVLNEYIYIEELPPRLYSESIYEKFDNIFSWLELQDINEQVIFLLMIIVAIITMITTYLILILERTKTIGILKSLGANNMDVVKIFLYCAFYIILRGMIIGNLLGFGIALFQKITGIISLDEKNYLVDTAPILFDFPVIVLINAGVLILTLMFLLIPSLLIAQVKPVRIFRFN